MRYNLDIQKHIECNTTAYASCYNSKAYDNKDMAKTIEQSVHQMNMAQQHNYLENPITLDAQMMPLYP